MDDYGSRFDGVAGLVGGEGLARLRAAHVCVIGLGGVGSWAVEALARSGVGALTLVDGDAVCLSNVNRQSHALTTELGRPKAEVLARRVKAIQPECRVRSIAAFFGGPDADPVLDAAYDYVIDAIDRPAPKSLLIARCRDCGLPVITSGAAGGRRDPLAIRVVDLALATHDRLLLRVRKELRDRFGFPPRRGAPFGVDCVYAPAAPGNPRDAGSVAGSRNAGGEVRREPGRGYGTACFVTGAFGFAAAALVVNRLAGERGL